MVLGCTEYQLHQFSMCEWVISCHLTWREQHSSTEKSNLLVRHLYTAQAFSQVKHRIHKVVTAFGDREGKKWHQNKNLVAVMRTVNNLKMT